MHLIEAPVLVLYDVECNRVANALGFVCAQQVYPSTYNPAVLVVEGCDFTDNSVQGAGRDPECYGVGGGYPNFKYPAYSYGVVAMTPGSQTPCASCVVSVTVKNSRWYRNTAGCG